MTVRPIQGIGYANETNESNGEMSIAAGLIAVIEDTEADARATMAFLQGWDLAFRNIFASLTEAF